VYVFASLVKLFANLATLRFAGLYLILSSSLFEAMQPQLFPVRDSFLWTLRSQDNSGLSPLVPRTLRPKSSLLFEKVLVLSKWLCSHSARSRRRGL
jgi:hypothetical protein